MEFIDAFDPRWSGALPATFIYDDEGHLRHAIHGLASYAQFERDVRDVLSQESSRECRRHQQLRFSGTGVRRSLTGLFQEIAFRIDE